MILFEKKKWSLSDQVFGANLANLCQRENDTVPKFVKLCIEYVEEYGKKLYIYILMLSIPTHVLPSKFLGFLWFWVMKPKFLHSWKILRKASCLQKTYVFVPVLN